ncbi:disulfide formation protein C [Bacillus cereus]|uniref:DUF1540 domain-containing protein n=1 Tax=Bacillus cereus TaxID=1396 RepID=UPI000BFCC368|nr:DUF1540 domain-containing protein [Bacillus cereus]PGZ10557.1 disulfide formation protein C [Bacillus cereus]
MPEVKCSVSNCSFWGQGNFCQANAIVVQPDAQETGQTENDAYTGAVLTNETLESSVTTSVETCCHTFKPKY